MKFQWGQHKLTTLTVTLTSGEDLTWVSSLWNRSGNSVNNGIFSLINDWAASADKDIILQIEEIYSELHDCFNGPEVPLSKLKKITNNLISELYSCIPYDDFYKWCIEFGNIELEIGVKDKLDDKDKEELTYYTQDYIDLVIFSELLKLVMPIWGGYNLATKSLLSKNLQYNALLDVIRNNYIASTPAMYRLTSYIDYFIDNKIKSPNFSIMNDVGGEELNDYLLAVAMVKKIATFNSRVVDNSIVTNTYNVVNQTCKNINGGGPNKKKTVDETGEEISITDRYKVVQRFPPAVSVLLEVSAANLERMVLDIGGSTDALDPSTVVGIRDNLPPNIPIEPYHLTLISAVCADVIHIRSLELATLVTIRNLLAVCNTVLLQWGFPTIAKFIIATPSPKDIMVDDSKIKVLTPLSKDIISKLQYIYPYKNKTTAGEVWLEEMRKFIIARNWELEVDEYKGLLNDLARLLIKIGE